MANANETSTATPPAHTPTPWEVEIHGDHWGAYLVRQAQDQLQKMFESADEDETWEAYRIDEANARFIKAACNGHDELLGACEQALNALWEAAPHIPCNSKASEACPAAAKAL